MCRPARRCCMMAWTRDTKELDDRCSMQCMSTVTSGRSSMRSTIPQPGVGVQAAMAQLMRSLTPQQQQQISSLAPQQQKALLQRIMALQHQTQQAGPQQQHPQHQQQHPQQPQQQQQQQQQGAQFGQQIKYEAGQGGSIKFEPGHGGQLKRDSGQGMGGQVRWQSLGLGLPEE